jgi:hypothetical protein
MDWLVRVSFEENIWIVTDGIEKRGPYATQILAVSVAAAKAAFAQAGGARPRIEVYNECGKRVALWPDAEVSES